MHIIPVNIQWEFEQCIWNVFHSIPFSECCLKLIGWLRGNLIYVQKGMFLCPHITNESRITISVTLPRGMKSQFIECTINLPYNYNLRTMHIRQNILELGPRVFVTSEALGLSQITH